LWELVSLEYQQPGEGKEMGYSSYNTNKNIHTNMKILR
jgi:hypothetical protein